MRIKEFIEHIDKKRKPKKLDVNDIRSLIGQMVQIKPGRKGLPNINCIIDAIEFQKNGVVFVLYQYKNGKKMGVKRKRARRHLIIPSD